MYVYFNVFFLNIILHSKEKVFKSLHFGDYYYDTFRTVLYKASSSVKCLFWIFLRKGGEVGFARKFQVEKLTSFHSLKESINAYDKADFIGKVKYIFTPTLFLKSHFNNFL